MLLLAKSVILLWPHDLVARTSQVNLVGSTTWEDENTLVLIITHASDLYPDEVCQPISVWLPSATRPSIPASTLQQVPCTLGGVTHLNSGHTSGPRSNTRTPAWALLQGHEQCSTSLQVICYNAEHWKWGMPAHAAGIPQGLHRAAGRLATALASQSPHAGPSMARSAQVASPGQAYIRAPGHTGLLRLLPFQSSLASRLREQSRVWTTAAALKSNGQQQCGGCTLQQPLPLDPSMSPLPIPLSIWFWSEGVQHMADLLLAWGFWSHAAWLRDHCIPQLAKWIKANVLEDYIQWLMTAKPAGVKLHAELTQLLGLTADTYINAYSWGMVLMWQLAGTGIVALVAACAGLLGASSACALLQDLLLAAYTPQAALYCCIAWLYRQQLHALHLTWTMMRGSFRPPHMLKLKAGGGSSGSNTGSGGLGQVQQIQQQQSLEGLWGMPDSHKDQAVAVEQLIVGVLLFVPLLALLPTSLMWYLLALLLHLHFLTAHMLLGAAATLLRPSLPMLLLMRLVQPCRFPSGRLSLHVLGTAPGEHMLASIPHSLPSNSKCKGGRLSPKLDTLPDRSNASAARVYLMVQQPLTCWEVMRWWVAVYCGRRRRLSVRQHVFDMAQGAYTGL